MTKKCSLGFAVVLLAGCGGYDIDVGEIGSQQDTVIGGTPTSGDPAIVALFGRKADSDEGMLCTATVISPTVLLTAAHCVDPAVSGEELSYVAVFGHDLTDAETIDKVVAIESTHFHPQFNANSILNGYDIGVAILAEPTDVTPVPFNTEPLTSAMKRRDVRIVGYGVSNGFDSKGETAGVKREANVKLNNFDEKLMQTGGWGGTICTGDSGGPAIMEIDGEATVVGIHSFGPIFCWGAGNSTRVDTFVDWLEPYLD